MGFFSLLEEEWDIISIPTKVVKKGKQLAHFGLVVKLLSKHLINKTMLSKNLKTDLDHLFKDGLSGSC